MKLPFRLNVYLSAEMKEAVQNIANRLTVQSGVTHTLPDAIRHAIYATAKKMKVQP